MATLGERFGAKADRIALAQSLRIMMAVVIIPITLTFLDAHEADSYTQVLTPVNAVALMQLLALGLLGGTLLAWLGVRPVTAAHVTRALILVTTTGPLFRLAKRLSAKSA